MTQHDGVIEMLPTDVYPVPAETRFFEDGTHEFIEAPDLEAIAEKIMTALSMDTAADFDIRYLWKAKQTASAMGKCAKATGTLKHYTDADFVIWIAADGPRDAHFTMRQVEAVLYHELLHVSATEKGDPALRKHDAEVFREELQVYGLWDERLQHTFGQLEMPLFHDRGARS